MRTAINRSVFWVLLAGAASSAVAHHSFAMFDQAKRLTLKGTVSEFQWTNPHAFIHLAVTDASGKAQTWDIELNSPNNLKRQGWRSDSIKAGDQVQVIINPLRDGSHGGLFLTATLPNGKVLGELPDAARGPINAPKVE